MKKDRNEVTVDQDAEPVTDTKDTDADCDLPEGTDGDTIMYYTVRTEDTLLDVSPPEAVPGDDLMQEAPD
jgi:hypothetical protein